MHHVQCSPYYYNPYDNGHNDTIGDHHFHDYAYADNNPFANNHSDYTTWPLHDSRSSQAVQ